MNPSSNIPLNRCTQISADDFANPLEELSLHRLWRRPAPPAASTLHPLTRGLWPVQLALDKIERTISKHLFWLTRGHFEMFTMEEWFQMRVCTIETECSSSTERVQNPLFTPHLAQHQRDQRANLLNWGLRDRRARLEICSKQLETMNLHHYAPPPQGIKPRVLLDPAANRYIERVMKWIENAYDQRTIPPDMPQPLGRPTSGQLSDISIGLDLLQNQFETSGTELDLHKFITRCNWGRFLVKLSLFAPIVTLLGPWGGLFKLSGFGVGLIGLITAARIWTISYDKCTDGISYDAEMSIAISKLILKLLDREDEERAREGEERAHEIAQLQLKGREEFLAENEQLRAQQQAANVSPTTSEEELREIATAHDESAEYLAREEKALNTIEKIREDLRRRGIDCESVFESILQTNDSLSPTTHQPEVVQLAVPPV